MSAQDEQHLYSLPLENVPVAPNDYDGLINKPKINGHTLEGDLSASELGINVPTKVSDLDNDAHYATESQIPTQLSQLSNNVGFTTQAYVDQEVGAIETSLQDIDGALVIKHLLLEETFTSTFDNLASNLTTKLTAIQSALHTREIAGIKALRINTIGNVKPSHIILINSSTVIGSLDLDWHGVSYVNNVLQAIDVVNKKVLQMTMTNDRPANDAFVSYFEDTTAYTFTIEYTVYKEISLS